MEISNNRANTLVNLYGDLLSDMFSDRCISNDIYTLSGFHSFAVVNVDIPECENKPTGFIYKENDKIFICIDKDCNLNVRNYAKAYLVGLYLIHKQDMPDGIYKDMFYYPVNYKHDDYEELMSFVMSVLLPKEEVEGIVSGLVEGLNLKDDIAAVSEMYHVPAELVYERLQRLKLITTDKKLAEPLEYDEEKLSKIVAELDRNVHTVSMGTFESCKIMIDYMQPIKADISDEVEEVEEFDEIQDELTVLTEAEAYEKGISDVLSMLSDMQTNTSNEAYLKAVKDCMAMIQASQTKEVLLFDFIKKQTEQGEDITEAFKKYLTAHATNGLGIVVRNNELRVLNNVRVSDDNLEEIESTDSSYYDALRSILNGYCTFYKGLKNMASKMSDMDNECNKILHDIEFGVITDEHEAYTKILSATTRRRLVKQEQALLSLAKPVFENNNFKEQYKKLQTLAASFKESVMKNSNKQYVSQEGDLDNEANT